MVAVTIVKLAMPVNTDAHAPMTRFDGATQSRCGWETTDALT